MTGQPTPTKTEAFRRPTSRMVVDLIGPPFGAAMFLGFGWMLATGAISPDPSDPLGVLAARIVFPVLFFPMCLLLATAIPGGIRRGLNPTVLRVGPGGMWTPEMGLLAWSEIAEVRLESVRGFGGHDDGGGGSLTVGSLTIQDRPTEIRGATYQRLGIVPADPARTAAVRRSLSWRAFGWLLARARSMRPGARVQDLTAMAPFGVYAYELRGALGPAIHAVERFHEVGGIPERPGQASGR